eukprot:g8807.t1
MPMQMAIILAALCSGSCTGVLALLQPTPRTCRFGFQHGSGVDNNSAVFQRQHGVEVARSALVGSRLYGMEISSSGSDEVKEASSDATQRTGENSDVREKPARVNLVKKYGSAGLVAYGLLNGLWYTGGITYVMLGPMGLVPAAGIEGTISASAKQLGKVVGLVWLGSQATKPVRYALAALLSPATDRLIDAAQRRLGLPKKADAVKLLVVSIFGSTCLFCLVIIAFAVARATVVSTAAATTSTAAPASSSCVGLLLPGLRKRGGMGHGLSCWCSVGGRVNDGFDVGGDGRVQGVFPLLPTVDGGRHRASAFDREREEGAASRPRRRVGGRLQRALGMFRGPPKQPKDYRQQL